MVTAEEKLRAMTRELAIRNSAYPKWVASGRMKASVAEHEIAVMAAIVEDYRQQINSKEKD